MLDPGFQDILKSLKERQTFYRGIYPEKPRLLSFAFHKVHFLPCWLVKCTPYKTPQVIGINDTFDFDVSTFNPPWMNNIEDGCLTERPRRMQVPPIADDIQDAIRINLPLVVELGFAPAQAQHALEACRGNLERAVAMLFQFDD